MLLLDQINNDYCDCPDGLDEPGTNACAYDPESPKYFCANEGFKPGFLESYKLNDGVCDYDICCDGSDENVSGQCPNLCAEARAQYERFIAAKKEDNSKGLKAKKELKIIAAEMKTHSELHLNGISQQIKELQDELKRLQSTQSSGTVSELNRATQLIVSEVDLQSRLESYKLLMAELHKNCAHLEAILTKMSQNYNPNFNDGAVKNAVHSFQDYFSNKPATKQISFEFDDIAMRKDSQESFNVKLQGSSSQAPTFFNMIHYYYEAMVERFPKHDKTLPAVPSVVKERQSLSSQEEIDLKSLLESKQRELINEEQKNIKDYGEDDILRAVEGKWYEKVIGDYNYRIGFLNAIYQDNTLVGRYAGMEGNSMQFINGDRCWNGPQRSATVDMVCNHEYDLVSVFEPQKCHYQFKLMSPLVCEEFSEEITGSEFKFDRTKIDN